MATRARITSVEALEAFRASLIVYQSRARAALEEVSAEVTRTRNWVQTTQRTYWNAVAKKRARDLEEAQAVLFGSRMSNLKKVTAAEQMAVAKAKRAMEEAEAKLRLLKRWDRDFDNHTGPPTRQMEKLHAVLAGDLEKASEYLKKVLTTLDAYAGMRAPTILESGQSTGEKPVENEPDAERAAEAIPVKGEVS